MIDGGGSRLAIWLAVACSLAAITGGPSAASVLTDASESPVDPDRTVPSIATGQSPQTADSTPIDGCRTIEEPGRYVLTRDVSNDHGTRTSQNCVWINTSDVVLDGASHEIDGIGVSDSTGVYVGSDEPLENVTVRNLAVSDWHRGVWFRNVSQGSIQGVNATENAFGLAIENASHSAIRDNEASGNLVGISVDASNDTELSGNDARSNHVTGIYGEVTALEAFGTDVSVGPPLDHTGDGRYEDVTGNGESGIGDALTLFGIVSAETAGISGLKDDQRRMFDFDRDGRLDYGDVWTLVRR